MGDLPFQLDWSPDLATEAWRMSVPAKPAVYLLIDERGQPLLLAVTGNLRGVLERRLEAPEHPATNRKVDYRAVVRGVAYRPVFSRFEADWAFFQSAMIHFPQQWRRMIRHRRAAWLSIDLNERFPRLMVKDRPTAPAEGCFGPIGTAKLARECVAGLQDQFDLCREHALLVQAPGAVACSYKQMGRCPAPCDGSTTMDHYRGQLRRAVDFLAGRRQTWIADQQAEMKRAAAELRFEAAQLVKARLDKARLLDHPALRHVGALTGFRWLVLQRGRRKGCPRFFLAGPCAIRFLGELQTRDRPAQIDWLVAQVRAAEGPMTIDQTAGAWANLTAWHLTGPREPAGVFVKLERPLEAQDIQRAVEALERSLEKKPGRREG